MFLHSSDPPPPFYMRGGGGGGGENFDYPGGGRSEKLKKGSGSMVQGQVFLKGGSDTFLI